MVRLATRFPAYWMIPSAPRVLQPVAHGVGHGFFVRFDRSLPHSHEGPPIGDVGTVPWGDAG
jgi:hypothetical protein